MAITYNGEVIAEVKCTAIMLQRGLGIYQLRFSIDFNVAGWADRELRFEDARMKVTVCEASNAQEYLGHALPELPLIVRTASHPNNFGILFDLPLTPSQLSALEGRRNGGDISCKLTLHGHAYGNGRPWPAHADFAAVATQSEWIKQLRLARYSDTLLFEVPMPFIADGGTMKTSIEYIRRARAFFDAGHYDETVSKCRLAIEAMAATDLEKARLMKAVKSFTSGGRREMSVTDRMLLLRETAKHYTQLAHHDLEIEQTSEYSRLDAVTILGITAALATHRSQSAGLNDEIQGE
jgi:hypothetical protein